MLDKVIVHLEQLWVFWEENNNFSAIKSLVSSQPFPCLLFQID